MNRWVEQLKNHQINESINQLKEWASTEFDDIDETELNERSRFLKALELHSNILENIDPELVPFNQIDGLDAQLRSVNIWNQVNSYSSNGNGSHLANANNHLSSHLTQLCLLKSLSRNSNSDASMPETESLEYAIRSLIKKKDELGSNIDGVAERMVATSRDVEELNSLVEQRKSETDSIVTQWQQQFSEAQEKRSARFQEWLDGTNAEAEESINEIADKYKTFIDNSKSATTNELNEIIADSKDKHESILSLYELTAGDSVAAGYMKNANDESKQANRWRWNSVAFIFITIAWLLTAYFMNNGIHAPGVGTTKESAAFPNIPDKSGSAHNSSDTSFDWYKLITTFSLTGVLLFGAAYSSQQSNKHRENEKRNKWFALQMKAFDPFVSTLSPESQQELKKELSEKLFGNYDNLKGSNTKVVDEHAMGFVVKSITDILSKLPKN